MSPCLSSFPEELVEHILTLALHPRPSDLYLARRPSWHPFSRTATSIPLVSKSWLRISTPLFYHTILLSTPAQALALSTTFTSHASLGTVVRRLIVQGCWSEAAGAVAHCTALETLDLTICGGAPLGALWDSLQKLDVRYLVVRKPQVVGLKPSPLADVITHWKNLETAHIEFRMSDDTYGFGSALATALSASPCLHTLSTHLPAVWNSVLLRISENPCLERIVLRAEGHDEAIVGTGLFLRGARNWGRLSELIRNGTPIIRSRAHTMGTISPGSVGRIPVGRDHGVRCQVNAQLG